MVLVNARNRDVRCAVTGFAVADARDLLSRQTMRGDTLVLPAYGELVLER